MKSHRRGMLEPPGQELLVAAAGRALWIWFSSGLLYDGCGKKQKPLEVPARGGDLSFSFCCTFLRSLLLSFILLRSPFLDGPLNGGEL